MDYEKTGILIQARSGSTRLPAKILKTLPLPDGNEIPLLLSIYLNFIKCKHADQVVVLIPDTDEKAETFCRKHKIHFFSGSENDVRERYRHAAKEFNLTWIVRATGDNPFMDSMIADDTIMEIKKLKADLFSFTNLPIGIAVEAFHKDALFDDRVPPSSDDIEHVSLHIKHHPEHFRIEHKEHPLMKSYPLPFMPRLTVDTPEDFEVARSITSRIGTSSGIAAILDLLCREPELFKTNLHVPQKTFPKKIQP